MSVHVNHSLARALIFPVCLIILFSFLLIGTISVAEEQHSNRPEVGLVLSGGGARGAAHIGVLKVLRELRIPVDYIVGTSMGSIIGGLYASGMSIEEIEDALKNIDWNAAFQDKLDRKDRSFRRKRDDDFYLMEMTPGFRDGELIFPSGVVQGQKIDLILKSLTLPVAHVTDFDELSIPYRAVASDIVTGEAIALGNGDLALAMRASMSVPSALSPVEIEGRLLVDGGVANNLPVDVARQLGADIVIAVDISTPLKERAEINSMFSITGQLSGLLTRRNTEAQINSLTDNDILIVPDLGGITTAEFSRVTEAVPTGAIAANKKQAELHKFSLSEASYAAHVDKRRIYPRKKPTVDFIRINNRSQLNDEFITARLNVLIGEPLDTKQLEEDIGRIYGLELFENVRYDIIEEEGKTGVVLDVYEKSWGPNYMRFGISFSNKPDEGETTVNLGVAYSQTALNGLGGEWRSILQSGEDPAIGTEIYQPLDINSRYFFNAGVIFQKFNRNQYDNNSNILGQSRITDTRFTIAIGRELSTWGEFRLALSRSKGDSEITSGDPSVKGFDFNRGLALARLEIDKMDNLNFPRSGTTDILEWRASRESLGADSNYHQLFLKTTFAKTWEKNTLQSSLSIYTTQGGDAPTQDLFTLGGFTNLSGLSQGELSGQHLGLFQLGLMHRLNDIQLLPSYLGTTMELGNVWQNENDVTLASALLAGSLWLGVDTFLGPLYLGGGYVEGGHKAIYLKLGNIF